MEAGTTTARRDRVEDDRRPAAARGRAATATTSPSATSATARGTTSPSREVGEIVARDRARPDRPRHRSPATASASSPTRAPSGPTATSAITQRRRASSCRSTRRTRPRSASGSRATPSAVAIICEDADAGREDRRGPRRACPRLRTSIVDRPRRATRRTRSRSTSCARAAAARDRAELDARAATPSSPTTRSRSSTRPARPGPPKGCVLTHGNYRAIARHGERARPVVGDDDVIYLFLPLAHSFALLIQLAAVRRRRDARLLRRRPEADRRRAAGGQADLPPVGAAHLREDLHARHGQRRRRASSKAVRTVGVQVRDLERRTASRARRSCGEQFDAGRRGSCSERRARPVRRPHARRRSPARRRSRPRSSSSSTAAACRCSRATA